MPRKCTWILDRTCNVDVDWIKKRVGAVNHFRRRSKLRRESGGKHISKLSM
jgi:hypothetical protein